MKKLFMVVGILAATVLIAMTAIYLYFVKDSADYEKSLGVKRAQLISYTETEPVPGAPYVTDMAAADIAAAAGPEADSGLSEKEADMDSITVDASGVIYLLFLGTDRLEERDDIPGIVYHTDTILLARVDLTGKKIKLLNIPRDTYTYLQVVGRKDRINAAYSYGSKNGTAIQSTINTVEAFLGRPVVDYYFLIELEPIPEIVDSLGGVMLDVEIDMKTHGADLSKGYQLLDGRKAYDYIHWRFSGMGDIDRIKRQQKFAKAMYQKIRDEGKFMYLAELALKYNSNIKTSLTQKQLISFVRLLSEISVEDISYFMIPGTGRTIDKKSVWIHDEAGTKDVLNKYFSNE